jgi:transposase
MPMAQLIITAVTVEGRTKSEVARDYGVSRYWVQQLVQRYEREGPIAFQPRAPAAASQPAGRGRRHRGDHHSAAQEAVQAGPGRGR